jgi:hypothetical protein
MNLKLLRYSDNGKSTLGLMYVDGGFECYSLEDTHREVKVAGETRIPSGHYRITLRDEGGMTKRYARRYPGMHRGMLWLRRVPNFEWVYIHVGNTVAHTDGCILTGGTANSNAAGEGFVGSSSDAYVRLYQKVVTAMDRGETVFIEVRDIA